MSELSKMLAAIDWQWWWLTLWSIPFAFFMLTTIAIALIDLADLAKRGKQG